MCGDLEPHLTHFVGPTKVHIPNGISIGSAIFTRLTIVRDRQTGRQIMLLRLQQ